MQSSPVLEIELHKTFESYPNILAQVFVEHGFLTGEQAEYFEVYYSAYKNRLTLPSGRPDMIVGTKGSRIQYLIEIKTISKLVVDQIVSYHKDILASLQRKEYPHLAEKIIPVFVLPQIAKKEKVDLDKKGISYIELDSLQLWKTENIIRERDRRIWQSGQVLSAGFEYITEKSGMMLFRRPKRFSKYV